MTHTENMINFDQQWRQALSTVNSSFEIYGQQLLELRHEHDRLIDVDTVQVTRSLLCAVDRCQHTNRYFVRTRIFNNDVSHVNKISNKLSSCQVRSVCQ
jgi:hypothetical protein